MTENFKKLINRTIENIQKGKDIRVLEEEWGKYKYLILEYSPSNYQAIRQLLKDKDAYPAQEFLALLEEALQQQPKKNVRLNAYDHVWGHFKKLASEEEEKTYRSLLEEWKQGEATVMDIKHFLSQLAQSYQDHYLLDSYFFE